MSDKGQILPENQSASKNDQESTPVTTYGELKKRAREDAQSKGKKKRSHYNYERTFDRFMEVIGVTDETVIGPEFRENYDKNVEKFGKTLNVNSVTLKSYTSHIERFEALYRSSLPLVLPRPFYKALLFLITGAGYTIMGFWRDVAKNTVALSTLQRWCTGEKSPRVKSFPIIRKLEKLLGVEENTLLSRIYRRTKGMGVRPTGLTEFGRRIQEALNNRYGVWTNKVERQCQQLLKLKVSAYTEDGVERNSAWTFSTDGKVPTSDIVRCYFRSFLGFCCLPKHDPDPYESMIVMKKDRLIAFNSGLGLKKENMSLALLAVKEFTVKYLEFQKVRAGFEYTEGTAAFIRIVSSLLRPSTGYIYQHPELAQDLSGVVEDSHIDWHQRCSDTRNRLNKILKDLDETGMIVYGRDPEEPIQEILAADRPLHIIGLMLKEIEEDMPPPAAPKIMKAIHFRNFLLLLMLAANPLRINHFAIMEIGKHIFKKADGSWWYRFSKAHFKNRGRFRNNRRRRNKRRPDGKDNFYEVRINPNLWKYIDEYISVHRKELVGADECSYLFRQKQVTTPEQVKAPMSSESLSNVVREMTYFYIPDCPGFGPHAFRHIVATDLIKEDPRLGFFLAAIALNDTIETVEENYEHLKTSEFFEPVNEHFSQVLEHVEALAKAPYLYISGITVSNRNVVVNCKKSMIVK